VSTVCRELIFNTVHKFDYHFIGCANQHPDAGKILDMSKATQQETGVEDAKVILYPHTRYDDMDLIRSIINQNQIDGLVFITDPRYYEQLFRSENEIRSKIPMVYINIWDSLPYPKYNANFYKSCDMLLGISKQTKNINKVLIGEENCIDLDKDAWGMGSKINMENKHLIKYFPHGIDSTKFYPIEDKNTNLKYQNFKRQWIKNPSENDFVLFWNNRNIHRKNPLTLLLGFKAFVDQLPEEKQKHCYLIMHTQTQDPNGTDLRKSYNDLLGEKYNVLFSESQVTADQLNYFYNMSDVTVSVTNNEGYGLSLGESRMAGTMIISSTTGGCIDQMRFIDEKGKWLDYNKDFGSNHNNLYKKCGVWAIPIEVTRSMQGSIPTPYISKDEVDFEDVALAIAECYSITPENRKKYGLKGREWSMSDESQMESKKMGNNFINSMDVLFNNWVPKSKYSIDKIKSLENKPLSRPLSYSNGFEQKIKIVLEQ
jgi:glycosyltransferase involved in cell wall biosynthesis